MVVSKILRWVPVPVAAVLMAGVAAIAAIAASLPFEFIHFGNFTRMVESGQSGGQVLLADLPQRKGDWGLGATAGLKGEIVQIDGRLLVTPGSDAQGRFQAPQHGEEAVLFACARLAAAQADTRDYLVALGTPMRKAVEDDQDISAAVKAFDARPWLRLVNAADLMPGNASHLPRTRTGVGPSRLSHLDAFALMSITWPAGDQPYRGSSL